MNIEKKQITIGEKAFVTVESWCGRPQVTASYPSKPSWKTSGTGRAIAVATVEHNGSVLLHCTEMADGDNGRLTTKEVYVSLPKEAVAALLPFLTQVGGQPAEK